MAYLLAGPLVAIVGIVAVFFVLRRKSVDKRSMYSARRSQIEHKVRAARQRTMAPHGRSEKPSEPVPAAESPACRTDAARGARGTGRVSHLGRLVVRRQHEQGRGCRAAGFQEERQGRRADLIVAAGLWRRPGARS